MHLIFATLLVGAGTALAQPTVYRCGNEYTRVPCRDGKVIDTDDAATTAARRAEAARVVASEKRLAEEMARDRRRDEAAIKPALAGSLGPHKPAPPEAKVVASAKSKNKKAGGKRRADENEDFVAFVPKARK